MASQAVIPRFLLPLQSPLWRGIRLPPSQNVLVRFASTGGQQASKPIVLEKPAKFNPPSHGSRLRKGFVPRHYGPQLTEADLAAQQTKQYPGMMAPEGTWAHWFWHSTMLHVAITMGTLVILGFSTFFLNYAYNSPFKDLVPPISDLWEQPTYFFAAWRNVILMHERDKTAKANEHRIHKIDDVAKREYFRKMHGIETKNPVTMVFGKDETGKSDEEVEAIALGKEMPKQEEKPRRKLFGIF